MTTQAKQTPTIRTMYSVEQILNRKTDEMEDKVITHRLPYPRNSEKLSPFKAKGYSFDRPVIEGQEAPVVDPLACTVCGRPCKTPYGREVHMRSHKEG